MLANGHSVGEFSVADPAPVTLTCTIPRAVVARSAQLVLTLVHPDGEEPMRRGPGNADWQQSFEFFGLALSRVF